MEAYILGIDVGTTTIKSCIFDEKGNEISLSSRHTRPFRGEDGTVTQNMYETWNDVVATIQDVIKKTIGIGEVIAIGVTGQGDGFWPLNKEKEPVQDALLWLDGRTCSIIDKWNRSGVIAKSGRVVFSGSPLAYATWYAKNDPKVLEETRYLLFSKDWIKYCLTGELSTDPTDLSDASLIDVKKRSISRELLEEFSMGDLLSKLPPMLDSAELVGCVTDEASKQTGLRKGVPVVNGMIDVAASAIGTGVIDPSMACTIVGTTLFNEIVIDNRNFIENPNSNDPSLICHGASDRWLLAYGTMTGTPNIDWLLDNMYPEPGSIHLSNQDLVNLLEKIPAGSEGILYLPFLGEGGERAPFVKPSASAQFFGLKSRHTKYHLLKAVCEGVAYSMKDCYENFPIDPQVIRIAGGGSKGSFWCQIFSDCIGKSIQVTRGDEIGAKGAAITAAVSAGRFGSLNEGVNSMVSVEKEYEPRKEITKVYDDGYKIYKKIIKAMWDIWDESENYRFKN